MSVYKKVIASVAIVGAAFALSGCADGGNNADGPEPTGPITLDFWHSASGVAGETMTKLVDKFNSEHKDKIVINASYQGSYDDTISKFVASVQSGKLPALLQANEAQTTYLKDSGLVAPAYEVAGRTGGYDFKQLIPSVSNYYSFEGKVYSMPAMVSMPEMYVNKDLLAKAGVEIDSLKTTDGLIKASKQIKEKTGKAGLVFHQNPWWLEELTASQGKLWCSPDNGVGGKSPESFSLKDEKVVDLWQKIGGLYADGSLANPGTDGAAAVAIFTKGEAAIQLNSSSGMGGLFKKDPGFDWTVVPLPRDSKEAGSVPGGNSVWAIKEGHSKWEQNAAWEFMKFLGSKETQQEILKTTGYLPVVSGATDNLTDLKPQLKNALQGLADNPVSKITAGCHSGALQDARKSYGAAISGIAKNPNAADEFAKADEKTKEAIANYKKRSGK